MKIGCLFMLMITAVICGLHADATYISIDMGASLGPIPFRQINSIYDIFSFSVSTPLTDYIHLYALQGCVVKDLGFVDTFPDDGMYLCTGITYFPFKTVHQDRDPRFFCSLGYGLITFSTDYIYRGVSSERIEAGLGMMTARRDDITNEQYLNWEIKYRFILQFKYVLMPHIDNYSYVSFNVGMAFDMQL